LPLPVLEPFYEDRNRKPTLARFYLRTDGFLQTSELFHKRNNLWHFERQTHPSAEFRRLRRLWAFGISGFLHHEYFLAYESNVYVNVSGRASPVILKYQLDSYLSGLQQVVLAFALQVLFKRVVKAI
jgi:hypothetical protein